MPKHVKINEYGRRIGESHPRAILSDHEADLLFVLLAEREALIAVLKAKGSRQVEIDTALSTRCLSFRCLAEKFEVHKQTVAKIASGARRCQTTAKLKPYP
jgi:hypothetical protein